jgi:NAD(P)-dependent dehydrogenase (short-subunit alcohol dehydrogenase family)
VLCANNPFGKSLQGEIMRGLTGKTAFVTGGASGIGFALGRAFAEAGMKVMLADIETDALAVAVKSLHNFGPNVRSVICDVADPVSVEGAAKASYEAFGNVHVVCNNAGVGAAGGIDNISLDNWRWVLDVNLMGVLHGIRTFLPHIRAHGEGGHIVNTASMAGMLSGWQGFKPLPGEQVRGGRHVGGAGDAAKAAWHWRDRALSRVCSYPHPRERAQSPGALWTNSAARPRDPGGRNGRRDRRTRTVRARPVACRFAGPRRNSRGYVFTHPERRAQVEERFAAILAALNKAAAR